MAYPESPNPNFTQFIDTFCLSSFDPFEFSDYLVFDDNIDQDSSSQSLASPEEIIGAAGDGSGGATSEPTKIKCKKGCKKNKVDRGCRVAFRTKSELEIMDDGFKWRKYGKKSVKNSPNPRNYYKCSIGGCNVKKRVERDRENACYVITTYEGIHNHESPSLVYYSHSIPLMLPSSAFPLHSYSSSST